MIIFTHHSGEPHGILGAQVAATFIQEKLSIPVVVVGIERDFLKEQLLRFIEESYAGRERVVAFSHLCGRKDILGLIQELKERGFMTILGGPQARQDYYGEPEADSRPHRFRGLKSIVDLALQGPVDGVRSEHLGMRDEVVEYPWTKDIFLDIDWSNLYTFRDTLRKLEVRLGQVLNSIGCPYAGKAQTIILPPPVNLREKNIPDMEVRSQGCIFCDVSRDKGYHGSVERNKVIAQILGLPEIDC